MRLVTTLGMIAGATEAGLVAARERRLRTAPTGHVLTSVDAWSADGDWTARDLRLGDDRRVFSQIFAVAAPTHPPKP